MMRQIWLPYITALIIAIISMLLWYSIIGESSIHMVASVKGALPWVVLSLGLSLAVLMGLAIRLTQLTLERKESYEKINQKFQQEIADRIHSEESKHELEKALLQGQKLQAMGTLAGGIAHDFNNLLYAIIGYVEITREDVTPETLTHKNLGKVLDAAKRGQELVASILTFSRRQHHEFKSVCLKDTIEGVLGLLRPTVPASVTIEFTSATHESMIMGNQTQLHQVLVNIINNAVDAMDGEGQIRITLNIIEKAEKYYKIEISDTGHGMDQRTIDRIFEPFYTTKEVGKGTGLGLSTAHSIMKEHGGEILVESQLGHGTTFTLLLPEHNAHQENDNGKNTVS